MLPGEAVGFRASSVVDGLCGEVRGGYDWGAIFDRSVAAASGSGDLIVWAGQGDSHPSYLAANLAILDDAALLALRANEEVVAIVVWDLASRGADDVTAAFRDEALRRGLRIEEISTVAA